MENTLLRKRSANAVTGVTQGVTAVSLVMDAQNPVGALSNPSEVAFQYPQHDNYNPRNRGQRNPTVVAFDRDAPSSAGTPESLSVVRARCVRSRLVR